MTDQALNKEREKRLIALSQTGHTTSRDILKADFGGPDINGLNIVNSPDGDLQFKPSMLTMLTKPRHWLGLIDLTSFAIWLINTRSFLIAAAASVATRLVSIMGFVDPAEKDRKIHINEILKAYSHLNDESEFLANVVSHEHIHILQIDDQRASLTSTVDDDRTLKEHLDSSSRMTRYFALEAEIQARLHTIVANGYQQHGVMPQNRLELFSFLQSQDVEVPEEAVALLTRSTSDVQSFLKFSRDEDFIDNNADSSAVKEINQLSKAFDADFLVKFWTHHIPKLYGDLIELYGDAEGSARMGFGHNIQLREMFYKQVQNIAETPGQSPVYFARMAQLLQMMPANQSRELSALVAAGKPYRYGEDAEDVVAVPEQIRIPILNLFGNFSTAALTPAAPRKPKRSGPWESSMHKMEYSFA